MKVEKSLVSPARTKLLQIATAVELRPTIMSPESSPELIFEIWIVLASVSWVTRPSVLGVARNRLADEVFRKFALTASRKCVEFVTDDTLASWWTPLSLDTIMTRSPALRARSKRAVELPITALEVVLTETVLARYRVDTLTTFSFSMKTFE